MAIDKQHMIVEITGEPYASRALAYKAAHGVAHAAWVAWAESQGGSPSGGYHGGLFFIGRGPKEPTQWRKPDQRGWASPKKGSQAAIEMQALPRKPRSDEIFKEVPGVVEYHYPNGDRGSAVIGFLFDGPRVGWIGDRVFAVLADPRAVRELYVSDDPECIIEEPVKSWAFPAAGLKQLTEAEYNFIIAEHDLRQERIKGDGNKIHKLS